jgi:hypothetical protein
VGAVREVAAKRTATNLYAEEAMKSLNVLTQVFIEAKKRKAP